MPKLLRFTSFERLRQFCNWLLTIAAFVMLCVLFGSLGLVVAEEPATWKYSPEQLTPFWKSDVIHRESVLFIRDEETGVAKANVLFPIKDIISIQDSTGAITYKPGEDFHFDSGSREIIVPANSKIVTKTAADLRRPEGSQKYRLTHRDGNGEILFGSTLEYHNMQTWITYSKAKNDWPVPMRGFNADALPKTIAKLRERKPLSIVLLGDSISTGCNASGWADGAPHQPAYQDLLKMHLESHYSTEVQLTNLAVGGTSTPWGITQIPKVVEAKPDLIILAFGMNDSSGRSPEEYGKNISAMISSARETCPDAEFILVASMLGNRDWITLKHDVFPKYRDELEQLCQPGIALADMTSTWDEFLRRKQDHDLTGNGVNHPNDFGHRVYAQILSSLLVESE
ncbi:MAG: SGNH/GDSL hydrolase family protein [Planctomycetaceae bacterium]|nr:SGNH/GDSL hydrolase family protein [Planctomycetaceae bacterium]